MDQRAVAIDAGELSQDGGLQSLAWDALAAALRFDGCRQMGRHVGGGVR